MSNRAGLALPLGNPYNAKIECHICKKNHRHYSGLNFLIKYNGQKRLCPCCKKIHIIGFKEKGVNFVFLGTSTFHLAHQDMILDQCITFETVCGGKIKSLHALYEKFISPFKNVRIHILVSAGLNDFQRSTLETLKLDFCNFKNTIAKTDLHTVNFGTLLKAPKLYLEYNKISRKNEINQKNLNKFEELNSYTKELGFNSNQFNTVDEHITRT